MMLDKMIYFAAPLSMKNSHIYFDRLQWIKENLNPVSIFQPLEKYKNTKDWKENYQNDLGDCNMIIFISDSSFVGKGVFVECYFALLEGKMVCELTENALHVVKNFRIVNPDDWVHYAVPIYSLPEK